MRAPRHLTVVAPWALVALAGCGQPTEVAVSVAVGAPEPDAADMLEPADLHARSRETARAWATEAAQGLRAAAQGLEQRAGRPKSEPKAARPPLRAPLTAPETAVAARAVVDVIRRAEWDAVGAAAQRLSEAGPQAWPAIREALLADRPNRKAEYRGVLDLIGGDVPNRYGHFARRWKRDHGFAVKLSEDWFTDLLALPPGRVSRALRRVHRDLIVTAAALRAAARIGANDQHVNEVLEALLDSAYVHAGTFRDEVGRAVRALGPAAVAPLWQAATREPEDDEDRRPAYARVQLDHLNWALPHEALATVATDRGRTLALLEAFASARPPQALEWLISNADADDEVLRHRARETLLAYTRGRAVARRRSVRLLGGKTTTRRAAVSYRVRAREALREALGHLGVTAEAQCKAPEDKPGACDEALAGSLFAFYDERRWQAMVATFDAALQEPSLERRAAAFDQLLASRGDVPDKAPVRTTYLDLAQRHAAAGEALLAAQALRKAALLADAEQARSIRKRARALETTGKSDNQARRPTRDPRDWALWIVGVALIAFAAIRSGRRPTITT